MKYCDDCGSRVASGMCINCHEELYIEEQYESMGEEVPESLSKKCAELREQIRNKS